MILASMLGLNYAISDAPLIRYRHGAETRGKLDALNAVDFIPLVFKPLGRQDIGIVIEGTNGVHLHLWRTTSRTGFQSLPTQSRDVFTLRFPLSGAFQRRDVHNEYDCKPGEAMLIAFDEMRDFRAGEDLDLLSATLSRTALTACRDAIQGEPSPSPLAFEPMASMELPGVRALLHMTRSLQERLLAGIGPSDIGYPLIEEMFFCQVLSVWPQRIPAPTREAARAPSAVRLAMDFIDANLGRPITIGEVAQAVGLGIRALQLAFRREIDRTPLQYIIERRLHRVHLDLREGSGRTPIMQVAGRWGFVHPSDFARRYRERFGCTPKETQRAALRR